MAVRYIPEGFETVTPYLRMKGARQVMDTLKRVFDAEEMDCETLPDGTIMHAQMRLGSSIVMMSEARGEYPALPCSLYLYLEDVDAIYKRGLKAGMESLREPQDEFYGDRAAGLRDSAGNEWWIATHQEDVSPEEMKRRQEKMMGEMSG